MNNINYYNNKNGSLFFGSQDKKKAHTSFDNPPVMPGFKKN